MLTKDQLQLIHVAARKTLKTDREYRVLLNNVAGVTSSKELTNASLEDVMAVLEDMGFRQHAQSETYWRDKVANRGPRGRCGERMVHKIRQLALGSRYPLAGLVKRFSGERTMRVEELRPREAANLIEMLKESAVALGQPLPPEPPAPAAPCAGRAQQASLF